MRQTLPSSSVALGILRARDGVVDQAGLVSVAWRVGWPSPLELLADPKRAVELERTPPRPFVLAPADDQTLCAMERADLVRRSGLQRDNLVDWELTIAGCAAVRIAVRDQADRARKSP
jgi:hypothetical protein